MEMQRGKKLKEFLSKKGLRTVAALLVCMLALQLLMTDKVMAETEGAQDTEEEVEAITLMYMDANGEFAQKTVQKAFSELSEDDLPECPDGVQFTGWDCFYGGAYARYEGKERWLCHGAAWFGESGKSEGYGQCIWWVDTDWRDDGGQLRVISEHAGIPTLYPGLRFQRWYELFSDSGRDYYSCEFVMHAGYENGYAILNYGDLSLPDKIVVGEYETKVILPTECEGYTDLVWQDGGETVTELILKASDYGYGGRGRLVTCVGYTPSADAKDQEPVLIPPVEAGGDSSDNTENGTGTGNNGVQASQPDQTVSSQPGQTVSSQQPSGKTEITTTTVNGAVVTQKEVTQSDLNDVQKNILGTYFTAMQNIDQDATLSAEQKQEKKAENVQAWINSALGANYSFKKGVYGVYELKASDLSQAIPILVDGVKAGDKVVIAHLKADGTWESVAATEVTDGAVYAKFGSLSPVFVAVLGSSDSARSPKTGDMDFGIFLAIAAVAALGIAVSVRRRTSENIG